MANENNKIKLLFLWDILSKNTDENHAMNADGIKEELAKRGISGMRISTMTTSIKRCIGKMARDTLSVLPIWCGIRITIIYVTPLQG